MKERFGCGCGPLKPAAYVHEHATYKSHLSSVLQTLCQFQLHVMQLPMFVLLLLGLAHCLPEADVSAEDPQQPAEYSFVDLDFWWELGELDWAKRCAKYKNNTDVQTRITGGSLAEPNMFPYLVGMLLLRAPKTYQCGGVLISRRWVLSAAHCLFGSTLGKVFLGSTDFANADSSVAVFNVSSSDFIIHEKYIYRGGFEDIGLIRLPMLAPLSKAVQLIPLARSFMTQSLLEGKTVTATGWGRTSDSPMKPNYLLFFVDAPVMKQEKCACFYVPGLVRSRNHICMDGADGRGTCEGDSGGPLTFYYKQQNYLIGLTSFGSAGGCEINYPSVFTRITSYLDWIKQRTDVID